MDHIRIAARVAARKKKPAAKPSRPERTSKPKAGPPAEKDFLKAHPEFACQAELSISVDFEGVADRSRILEKLKDELMAAIQTAVTTTARGLGVRATGVLVQPIEFDMAVVDPSDISDEME